MNAQTLSRKLKQAGFTRSTWSPVKGRGRSRATSGFEVCSSVFDDTIEVFVRDWNEERIENVHTAVIGFGFQKVAERGSVRIYKATN
jgi:nitrogen regulatory protein PII